MKRNAFALAMVLWISAILMASTIYLLAMYKTSVNNAQSLNDKLKAELLADSYIDQIHFFILTGKFEKNYIKNNLKNFSSKIYITNNYQQVNNKDNNISFQIKGGGEMLALYSPDYKILEHLIHTYTKNNIPYIDALKDWLDTDSRVSLNGAENGFYNVSAPYGCNNMGALQHPQELFLIKNFNTIEKKIQTKLLKYFQNTTYSAINPHAITPKTLSRLIKINDFQLNQLDELYKNDYNTYITKSRYLLQKATSFEFFGSSSIIDGRIYIKSGDAIVSKHFTTLYKSLYNKPYIIYKNLLLVK